MKRNLLSWIFAALFFSFFQYMYSQEKEWSNFEKDSIISPLDGTIQRFYYYRSTKAKQPLIVSLHQWGANYEEYNNSLAPQTKRKDWNYIHPDFRGSNKHIKACGSEYVISDIDEVIDWAIRNMNINKDDIYIVGASGGGYAALCSYMKSRHNIKEYSVWVPISDLEKWYYESISRKSHYAKNIISCTCGDCKTLDVEKARERSPLYWPTPVKKARKTKMNIYAGIHDGYDGAVPITHSIFFYNKIIDDLGGKTENKVSDSEIIWLLTARTNSYDKNKRIGERKILYEKTFENVSLTIFDGGHEILVNEIFNLISL